MREFDNFCAICGEEIIQTEEKVNTVAPAICNCCSKELSQIEYSRCNLKKRKKSFNEFD